LAANVPTADVISLEKARDPRDGRAMDAEGATTAELQEGYFR
jgi:hypothetical protein